MQGFHDLQSVAAQAGLNWPIEGLDRHQPLYPVTLYDDLEEPGMYGNYQEILETFTAFCYTQKLPTMDHINVSHIRQLVESRRTARLGKF
jgi:hypothetical protein